MTSKDEKSQMRTGIALVGCLVLGLVGAAMAADWPMWRGPNQDGASTETLNQAAWPASGPKVLWETTIGRGHCSVIVVGGKLYTLGRNAQEEDVVYCFDAVSGKELWTHTYKMVLPPHPTAFVGATPAVVDGRLYTYGGGADLHCLDAATGKVIWYRNLAKELDTGTMPYGYDCSPAVAGGVAAVPVFPGAGQKQRLGLNYPTEQGVLVGFSAADGKEVWRVAEGASAWSSPIVAKIEGKEQFVHATGQKVYGVEPATGKVLWLFDGVAENLCGKGTKGDLCSTPIVHDDKVFFSAKGTGEGVCLQIAGGKPTILWRNKYLFDWVQTPALWKGRLYKGGVTCADMETGKILWSKKKVDGAKCLIAADGKLLVIDRNGGLSLVEITANGCEVVGTTKVLNPDKGKWPYEIIPVLADGLVFCRNSAGHMVCLDARNN